MTYCCSESLENCSSGSKTERGKHAKTWKRKELTHFPCRKESRLNYGLWNYHATCFFVCVPLNPLNAELNPICHLLALLGGATTVVVSRLRVKLFTCRLLFTNFVLNTVQFEGNFRFPISSNNNMMGARICKAEAPPAPLTLGSWNVIW